MLKLISLATLTAIATSSLTAPLTAQSPSTIDLTAVDRAVTAPATDAHTTLTQLFATEQGRTAISRVGLSPDAVAARVAMLDDARAERLADRVLAGGRGSIVISTTAIIIILLVLILITD